MVEWLDHRSYLFNLMMQCLIALQNGCTSRTWYLHAPTKTWYYPAFYMFPLLQNQSVVFKLTFLWLAVLFEQFYQCYLHFLIVLSYKLFTCLLEIISLIYNSFLYNLDINYLLVYCGHCKYHVSNHSSKTVSMVIVTEQKTSPVI